MEPNRTNPETKIKIYDFKRPDRFSKEHLAALSKIYETFARLLADRIPMFIQNKDVRINLSSVDELPYEEFIHYIPKPSTAGIINMDPLPGKALLEIDSNISSAMLNIVLGGKGVVREQHELTDIETSIMDGFLVRLVGSLRESWGKIIELKPHLEAIETNPEYCMIASPAQKDILAAFECCIGNIGGKINVYTPYPTLVPVINKLINQDVYNFVKTSSPESVSYALEEISVPWMVEFGRTRKTLKKIQEIKKGDCIKLDSLAGSPFNLFVDNSYIGQGEIDYLYSDIFGVRIVSLEEAAPGNTLPVMGDSYDMNNRSDNLNDMNVPLSVILEQGKFPIKIIKRLQMGKTFELSHFNGEQMRLFAGGIYIGLGEAVVIDDHFGIRITILEEQNV